MATIGGAIAASIKQSCSTIISAQLGQYFATTLNTEKNIVNLVMAQIQAESSFNTQDAQGPSISTINSSGARDYQNSGPIQNILAKGHGTPQSVNVSQGLHAWGCLQSMGWNHVKGASLKSGKCLIEQARPDLVSLLCINPGESIQALLNGGTSVQLQILAGLVILEAKYKTVKQVNGGFQVGTFVYPDKMSATFQAYIGIASTDIGNGSSTSAYVSSIMYGAAYKAANGPSTITVSNGSVGQTSSNGPAITPATGNNLHPVGC
jgi:hypothetical protein